MVHRKKMRRLDEPGHVRFLTFSCYHRLPLFGNDAIKSCFVQRLTELVDTRPVRLCAWVVMPEHVHLLLWIDVGALAMREFLMGLKRPVAKRVLARWRKLDADVLPQLRDKAGRRYFWQPGGGYDRNITSPEEYEEKWRYIHHNPVARGLVERGTDWMWSSARWYRGLAYDGPVITPVG